MMRLIIIFLLNICLFSIQVANGEWVSFSGSIKNDNKRISSSTTDNVFIRQLLNFPEGMVDSSLMNDSVAVKYILRKQIEVFGFHPYWNKDNYLEYNFHLISTLVYYGYELDENGTPKTINGWDTASVIDVAEQAGCKVQLCVFCTNKERLSKFLRDKDAQENLFNESNSLLKIRNANGINILFNGLEAGNRQVLCDFIKSFVRKLKQVNKTYELSLTIPVIDEEQNYDLKQLDKYVSRFIIYFKDKHEYGPIIPMEGSNFSLDATVSRWLNSGVETSKFIVNIPYLGVLWDYRSKQFVKYVAYNKVYDYKGDSVVYDQANARLDVMTDQQDTVFQLWYDDAKTLSSKYDYVIENQLAGVGIWTLGNDNGRPELWNAMMSKVYYVDTLYAYNSHSNSSKDLWEYIKNEVSIYGKLFNDPCSYKIYQQEMISDDIIGFVTFFFVSLLVAVGVYSVLKNKELGDDWEQKNMFLRVLITLVILTVTSLLLFCFLNPKVTFIGTNNEDCKTSFGSILIILGIGFFIGLLSMRFLVYPLMKRKEIP